jgi:drug/metabolite transporter (DMT)-like permease
MKKSVWSAFAALCLLSSTAWVAASFGQSTLPPLEQQGFLFGVIGIAALLFPGKELWPRSKKSKKNTTRPARFWPQIALGGIAFFGLPALANELASGAVPAISRTVLFSLAPIVIAIAIAAGNAAEPAERNARRSLAPSLAGIGGLLLLLPLDLPGSPRGRLMLAAVCIAVTLLGIASVRLYRSLQSVDLRDAAVIVCLSNAAFLLICSVITGEFVWSASGLASLASLSSLINLIEVPLLLWLLREMSPIRFASRYLLIPLLTIIESYIVMRPVLTLRFGAGAILLAAGAAMLLAGSSHEEEPVLSLR